MFSNPVGPCTAVPYAASLWGVGQTYENGFKVRDVLKVTNLVGIIAYADCTISVKQASWATAVTIKLLADQPRILQITEIVSIVSGTPGTFEMLF